MTGNIIKHILQNRKTMLITHTTTAARIMMATCAMNKNTTNRRIKFSMKTKKQSYPCWRPTHNKLGRSLVIITLMLIMLASVATAKGAVNLFNTHEKSAMTNRVKDQYNQPLYSKAFSDKNADDDDDVFRPMIPKDIKTDYISRNVFTKTGQYRVFQPFESDLRRVSAIVNSNQRQQLIHNHGMGEELEAESVPFTSVEHGTGNELTEYTGTSRKAIIDEPINGANFVSDKHLLALASTIEQTTKARTTIKTTSSSEVLKEFLTTELKSLEDLLTEYVENFFNKGEFEPLPELVIELQSNHTTTKPPFVANDKTNIVRRVRGIAGDSATSSSSSLTLDTAAVRAADKININLPRALQAGRLLFFTGLKKILWPIFVGLQILKSLLLAMFLPSLIGSFGKLVGKGIASASIRPMEAPQELDFRDNSFNFDEENNKFIINDDGGGKDGAPYAYNQPEASQTHYTHTTFNAANINNQALSRYGVNEKQLNKMPDSYMSVLQSLGAASFKNSGSFSSGSSQPGGGGGAAAIAALTSPSMRPKPMAAANNFQTFQKVPASSLLLSNYDPFYSPLLSRLDSVFAQLKLNSENEVCREKLICLMYANPAKYAPYSNLVSAQLSRELNELRKPTSDNPDILRFFKYMRAAKDGQDGVDCEESFDRCKEFKDFENPAMVSTYHDINKLVQARKIT